MPTLVTFGHGPGEELAADYIVSIDVLTSTTLRLNLSPALVNNAALVALSCYSIVPQDENEDPRERLEIFAADAGVGASTTTIVLTVEEMVQGAGYDLTIATWEVA